MKDSAGGDKDAAEKRLKAIDHLPILEVTETATHFAQILISKIPLPPKETLDALHIAITVVNGIEYLLTWNCTHLANAALRKKIDAICFSEGYEPSVICTPEELLEV